jgi:hypothetical protein
VSDATRPGSGAFSAITSFSGLFESWGRVVAGVASLGGLAYLIALVVMVIRLQDAGLPSVEVVSALPRDQLLVLGIVELIVTVAVAGVLVGLAILSSRLKALRQKEGDQPRRRTYSTELVVARWTVIGLMVISLLLVPISVPGLLWAAALIVLLVYLVLLPNPPLWQILLVAIVAGLTLTLTRQLEFPSPFAGAIVAIKADGESAEVPISGSYLGSTSSEVLIGVKDQETRRLERLLGKGLPSSLVMVPRARIEQVVLEPAPAPSKPSESIAEWLGVPIACLFPKCRAGEEALQTPQ